MKKHIPALLLPLLALAAGARTQTHTVATKEAAAKAVSAKAAATGAPDVSGRTRRPLEEAGKQGKAAAVLFFVTTDCPIANRFAPEINRICRDYQARGIAFYIVQADASLRVEQARSHAKAYGFSVPVLLDRKHDLVRLCGARITPEVAVVSTVGPGVGRILYRGRIDDRYASLGKPRLQASKHDLRLALEAVCAHKRVATPRTIATGCTIEG